MGLTRPLFPFFYRHLHEEIGGRREQSFAGRLCHVEIDDLRTREPFLTFLVPVGCIASVRGELASSLVAPVNH